MKKEARLLLDRALEALTRSIDHFNRPWATGREESVLIQIDRSFEMLLKSAIVHQGGKIREPRGKQTIGFDHCVRKCLTDGKGRTFGWKATALGTVAYSITWSARSSSNGGIVKPRALAVFRFMTSSNFVGCSMGRSAGLAPLRILST